MIPLLPYFGCVWLVPKMPYKAILVISGHLALPQITWNMALWVSKDLSWSVELRYRKEKSNLYIHEWINYNFKKITFFTLWNHHKKFRGLEGPLRLNGFRRKKLYIGFLHIAKHFWGVGVNILKLSRNKVKGHPNFPSNRFKKLSLSLVAIRV